MRCSEPRRSGLRLHAANNNLTLSQLTDLLEPMPRDRIVCLDVSHNVLLGDAAPQYLARCLPVLRELRLSGCIVGVGLDVIHGYN